MKSITDQEFRDFQRFIYDCAGISLSHAKKSLVGGRLSKRLSAQGIDSYSKYFELISSGQAAQERQVAIDLLTTNETYFFREPRHFEFLRNLAESRWNSERSIGPVRVWSAASSTGEEAYTIAMTLKSALIARDFEVLGTDISTRVLQRARTGHYAALRTKNIPAEFLSRYCLKGVGPYAGTLLVERDLRRHVRFLQANLNEPLPQGLGQFDAIFLRNVMIYFSAETKQQVVARVLSALRPGGFLFIGHSESLHGVSTEVRAVAPAVYLKPASKR